MNRFLGVFFCYRIYTSIINSQVTWLPFTLSWLDLDEIWLGVERYIEDGHGLGT